MDAIETVNDLTGKIDDAVELLRQVDAGDLTSDQLMDVTGTLFTLRDALDDLGEQLFKRREERASRLTY